MSGRRALRLSTSMVLAAMSLSAPALARDVVPPLGLQLYCLQHRASCTSGKDTSLSPSADLVKLLNQVNRQVNRTITPVADHGMDTWRAQVSSGDCEDYVLTKRQMLVNHGVSSGALRIAYTKTRDGEGHAILLVRTSQGDLVLDNLAPSIKFLTDTNYSVRSVSSQNPLRWISYD